MHALRQLLRKSLTHPVFLLTFDLPCARNVKPVSWPGVIISNTYIDDNCCFMNILFPKFLAVLWIINMFSPLIHVLFFLCFVSSLPLQEIISDHALLCDFPSSRGTLPNVKVCNRLTDTLCIYKISRYSVGTQYLFLLLKQNVVLIHL